MVARLNDMAIDRFDCRGGVWLTRSAAAAARADRPLSASFEIDSHDRQGLGLLFDWVEVEVPSGSHVSLPVRWSLRGVATAALASLLLGGLGWPRRAALWAGLLVSVVASAGFLTWPWTTVLLLRGLPEGLLIFGCTGVGVARFVRARRPLDRRTLQRVGALALVAFLARGVALNHPDWYYPDLMVHTNMAFKLRELGPSSPASRAARRRARGLDEACLGRSGASPLHGHLAPALRPAGAQLQRHAAGHEDDRRRRDGGAAGRGGGDGGLVRGSARPDGPADAGDSHLSLAHEPLSDAGSARPCRRHAGPAGPAALGDAPGRAPDRAASRAADRPGLSVLRVERHQPVPLRRVARADAGSRAAAATARRATPAAGGPPGRVAGRRSLLPGLPAASADAARPGALRRGRVCPDRLRGLPVVAHERLLRHGPSAPGAGRARLRSGAAATTAFALALARDLPGADPAAREAP